MALPRASVPNHTPHTLHSQPWTLHRNPSVSMPSRKCSPGSTSTAEIQGLVPWCLSLALHDAAACFCPRLYAIHLALRTLNAIPKTRDPLVTTITPKPHGIHPVFYIPHSDTQKPKSGNSTPQTSLHIYRGASLIRNIPPPLRPP